MKSKRLRKLVLSKYEYGDGTTKIFWDVNGAISLPTIDWRCRKIREISTHEIQTDRKPSVQFGYFKNR